MDNQQVPKADSKFQKIARKNHRKWKIRLLAGGGQKADSGGGPYYKKPDYNRAKSAPPGFGGSLEEAEQLDEVIRKKDGKYCLFSKKTNKNLGCYPTRAGAVKREKQVQYFKHLKETFIREEIEKALMSEDILGTIGSALGLTGDKKTEQPENKEQTNQKEGKKALVFGHSQSGGMGLDFVRILKDQGYKVERITKVGAGDDQLGRMIPEETGNPAEYEKIFYFAGANRPASQGTITANVNKLGGPSKVTVILAPYNMSKESPNVLLDPNTKGYRNEQELKSAGIRVYRPLFPPDVFWQDKIHVKPGTSIGMEFASDVISGRNNKYSNPSTASKLSTDFLSDLKQAITSSSVYKALKGFFTSKKTGALDSSEGLIKFKAHLNNNQDKMADLIYEEFVSAGLGPNIALAAIVNAYKESGLNPNAVGDGGHSIGLFQLHDRGGGSGMSEEERRDPVLNTQKMIKIIKGSFGRKLRAADEQGKSVPVLAAIFSRDVERPADKEGNMISRSKQASKWLGVDNVVDQDNVDQVDSIVTEAKRKGKDDRCTRIAKSKYDAWPSAYASGAVVKCRQGKIWKNIKEEEELDETKKKAKHTANKALATGLAGLMAVLPPSDTMKPTKKPPVSKKHKEELEEEWSDSERKKRKANCSNPKGFTMKQFCKNQRTRSKEGEKTNEGLEERKLGKPSSETNLGDWFKRKGAPGKKGGWVDCNTCRDGKCKPCGRQEGEKRSKYPRCRPTPSQCKGYKRRGDNLQREEQ